MKQSKNKPKKKVAKAPKKPEGTFSAKPLKLWEYARQASEIVKTWPLSRQTTLCLGLNCQCLAHKELDKFREVRSK